METHQRMAEWRWLQGSIAEPNDNLSMELLGSWVFPASSDLHWRGENERSIDGLPCRNKNGGKQDKGCLKQNWVYSGYHGIQWREKRRSSADVEGRYENLFQKLLQFTHWCGCKWGININSMASYWLYGQPDAGKCFISRQLLEVLGILRVSRYTATREAKV